MHWHLRKDSSVRGVFSPACSRAWRVRAERRHRDRDRDVQGQGVDLRERQVAATQAASSRGRSDRRYVQRPGVPAGPAGLISAIDPGSRQDDWSGSTKCPGPGTRTWARRERRGRRGWTTRYSAIPLTYEGFETSMLTVEVKRVTKKDITRLTAPRQLAVAPPRAYNKPYLGRRTNPAFSFQGCLRHDAHPRPSCSASRTRAGTPT